MLFPHETERYIAVRLRGGGRLRVADAEQAGNCPGLFCVYGLM